MLQLREGWRRCLVPARRVCKRAESTWWWRDIGSRVCAQSATSEQDEGPRFDRTPPQDIEAEQSVLGGMLLSKDAIADVIEVLRGNDFYRPAHQLVYDAVLDLYGRGEPADAVTVAAELSRAGDDRPGRRAPLPAHADLRRANGGQRRLLRRDRRPNGRSCAGWSRPAPGSCRWATARPVARAWPARRRRGRPGSGRDLRGHRAAHQRGLHPDRRPAAVHHGRAGARSRSTTATAACRPGSSSWTR